ncbi:MULTISPECIES: hypothetical protein [unclassified Pseudomonas]|uniref:hypothetical protein n=1 Tax=unclassified Pseudomonas TaxID=196821 RepID=UPI000730553C|nr:MULTISPECIES: hypothetical protein [unclassified Pseudomonas]KSW24203.1 hypothetical protein AOX63_10665 [Pseudomonas sp. ADP]OBP07771.1 hypothetical protein BAE52_26830 [Pseudomonas sp. EGD-AKN5]QOF86731.1 hypothetical protein IG194_08655 [Pseudomonas sp. ADPe]
MDSLTLSTQQYPPDAAPSAPQRLYPQKLSGVRYLDILEIDGTYTLIPAYGCTKHVTGEDLTNTDAWKKQH